MLATPISPQEAALKSMQIECLFVSRGRLTRWGRRLVARPGNGLPEEPVAGCDPVALAAESIPYCPPGSLICAWARRASARRRVKTASLTCRLSARRASLRVLPSASFLS